MRPTIAQEARDMAEELRDRTAPEYIDGRPSCSARDALLFEAAALLDEMADLLLRIQMREDV